VNQARWRVLIGSRSFGRATQEPLQRLEAAGCEVIPNTLGRGYRAEELQTALREMDAIITGVDQLTAEALAGADRLRVISKHGVGLDNIDLNAARSRGIIVTMTPDAIHDSVADLTLALLLALARRIVPAHNSTHAGRWERFVGTELHDKTLGIVGLGRIGKGVATRAQAFGMKVLAYDVFHDDAFAAQHEIQFVELDELLAESDFVSLHAALTSTNTHLIGAQQLACMKPTAYLINTARGGLIDEDALADALRAEKIAGAALDVFQNEPPGADSLLLQLENVITTPHIAGQTEAGLRRMDEMAAENVLRVLRNERPLYQVE